MSQDGKPDKEARGEILRVSSQYLGLGMTFAASVALFGWVGFEVGTRIGAPTLLTLLGVLIGGGVGFYGLTIQVMRRPREEGGHEESDED